MNKISIIIVLIIYIIEVKSLKRCQYPQLFSQFVINYNKTYNNFYERNKRCQIFSKNYNEILSHNKLRRSHTKGINEFSDLTSEEFVQRYTGLYRHQDYDYDYEQDICDECESKRLTNEQLNPVKHRSIDLRTEDIPIKHQGDCGSCWVFAATGVYEYYLYRTEGYYTALSEQMSVDCIRPNGCTAGGHPSDSFDFFLDYGVNFASVYPYEAKDTNGCRMLDNFNRQNGLNPKKARLYRLLPGNEQELVNFLHQYGWITVAINGMALKDYNGGIVASQDCPCDTNHAAILVGFDSGKDGIPYWIIKNSYGDQWGDGGYAYLEWGKNTCGIASEIPEDIYRIALV
ncbi:hypothetical protein PVAND_009297 [Polypedilum vanderplanki]|uniref:Uncharacterized protein n=1 Tax=Polypedilum vanderplanki TaxID=319348 RepID=A0A9J6CCV6_POLVA|nr:hypothetical protein PVAND_009297 [Polypedilum vanderplanki]